jgi:hypothetical protein
MTKINRGKEYYIEGVLYRLCACGICGKYFIAHKNFYGKEIEFIRGHFTKGKVGIYSKETLDKMSKSRLGKKHTKEHNRKIGEAGTGRKNTKETKEKQRESQLLVWANMPKEIREKRIKKAKKSLKIAVKKNTGGNHKKETLQKMSISGKGKHNNIREKNPNWKGGVSYLPYPPIWNKQLKTKIINRDNNKCQNPKCCGKKLKLSVHHINYDKNNCNDNNLITLCIVCNSKANHNRKFWIKLYSKIIRNKYV